MGKSSSCERVKALLRKPRSGLTVNMGLLPFLQGRDVYRVDLKYAFAVQIQSMQATN